MFPNVSDPVSTNLGKKSIGPGKKPFCYVTMVSSSEILYERHTLTLLTSKIGQNSNRYPQKVSWK